MERGEGASLLSLPTFLYILLNPWMLECTGDDTEMMEGGKIHNFLCFVYYDFELIPLVENFASDTVVKQGSAS